MHASGGQYGDHLAVVQIALFVDRRDSDILAEFHVILQPFGPQTEDFCRCPRTGGGPPKSKKIPAGPPGRNRAGSWRAGRPRVVSEIGSPRNGLRQLGPARYARDLKGDTST